MKFKDGIEDCKSDNDADVEFLRKPDSAAKKKAHGQVHDWNGANNILNYCIEPLHLNIRLVSHVLKYSCICLTQYFLWDNQELKVFNHRNEESLTIPAKLTLAEISKHFRVCCGISTWKYDAKSPSNSSAPLQGQHAKRCLKKAHLLYQKCKEPGCRYPGLPASTSRRLFQALLLSLRTVVKPFNLLTWSAYNKWYRLFIRKKPSRWKIAGKLLVHSVCFLFGRGRQTRYLMTVTEHGECYLHLAHKLRCTPRRLFGSDVVEACNDTVNLHCI